MLFQIIEENGVKKIQALTADTGAGAPVGSYLYLEKKSNPSGYLYCDGSTFDQTKYPALYQYLGTNVLPDWREFSAVGAEQNTTNVYDAQTNPNGVIHDHDVYTEGQAKDDQLQEHQHRVQNAEGTGTTADYVEQYATNAKLAIIPSGTPTFYAGSVTSARTGTTTHGKQKAVFIYIKATSGLTENQQENVLNTINENLSYSTTEHKTGKKWIDGKPIYEKTIIQNLEGANPFIGRVDVTHGIANIHTPIRIVMAKASSQSQGDDWNTGITIPAKYDNATFAELGQFTQTTVSLYAGTTNWTSFNRVLFTLEYTKTTDN